MTDLSGASVHAHGVITARVREAAPRRPAGDELEAGEGGASVVLGDVQTVGSQREPGDETAAP
ncbi:MAG TPA: hypothetical protein VIW24_22490 [Aldersonia sp.]